MGCCHPEPTAFFADRLAGDESGAITIGLELELQGIFVSASMSLVAKNSLSCFLRRSFDLVSDADKFGVVGRRGLLFDITVLFDNLIKLAICSETS